MRLELNYSISLKTVYVCQLRCSGNLLVLPPQVVTLPGRLRGRRVFEGCWAVDVLRCQHYQKWQRLWAKEQSNHQPSSAFGTTAEAANKGVNLCQFLEHFLWWWRVSLWNWIETIGAFHTGHRAAQAPAAICFQTHGTWAAFDLMMYKQKRLYIL